MRAEVLRHLPNALRSSFHRVATTRIVTTSYRVIFLTRQRIAAALWSKFSRGVGSRTSFVTDPRSTPQSILIVITGLIGDSVMCLPLVSATRQLWPMAHIAVLCRTYTVPLFETVSEVDELIVARYYPQSIRGIRSNRRLQKQIAEGRFDLALVGLGSPFGTQLVRSRIPVRVGELETPSAPLFTHHYSAGSPRTVGPSQRLDALRALGAEPRLEFPRLVPTQAARESIMKLLAVKGVSCGTSLIVLHPFGSTRRQHWPLSLAAESAVSLSTLPNCQTILVGGPETRAESLPDSAYPSLPWIDLRGQCTLDQLIALIELATVIVSTDSGPFHLAGCQNRPTLGLFRSSRSEHSGHYPSAQSLLGFDQRCDDVCRWDWCTCDPCHQMSQITPTSVIASLRRLVPQLFGEMWPRR